MEASWNYLVLAALLCLLVSGVYTDQGSDNRFVNSYLCYQAYLLAIPSIIIIIPDSQGSIVVLRAKKQLLNSIVR